MTDQKILTTDEVAELLRVHRVTVEKLRDREEDPLPAMPMGRIYRYDREEVLAWAKRQTVRGAAG